MIIALSGYGTCGKDTVADILVEEWGFTKYAWADTLRLAAGALNPFVAVEDGVPIRYNDALETLGYNEAKAKYPEFRRVLQYLGTDVGRNLISDNVWVDATISRIERERPLTDDIVIADTRFENEAEKVRSLSGAVVRVTRPGVGPASDHISETALDDYPFDLYLDNDSGLGVLSDHVMVMYRTLKSSN